MTPQCDNDVVTMASGQDITFAFIRDIALMFKKNNDEKMNIYVLNEELIPETQQGIKSDTWNIKNVPIENAKKFLSSFVAIQDPKNENNFAIQVKNELDFKYVFSEIVNNNKNNIDKIVSENHKQLDVIKNIRDRYNEIRGNRCNGTSFKGFDNEDVQLNYDVKTDSVSNEQTVANLTESAYYFGKHGLLMAITKSNNGKVNVFATNANMLYNNPYGGNDKYAGLFAVYDASEEDAERFIQKLSQYNMDKANYTNIDSQEKFEQFFQDHCKNNEIKIEDKEVDDGCCLFNLCGCGKQQNVVN